MLLTVIILQNILAAVYALYNRKVAQRYRSLYWHQTALVFLILYACALVFALPKGGIDFATSFDYLPLLIINGVCFGVGTGIAYLALRDQDAGVVNTTLMIRVPIAAILAYILLSQPLSLQNIIGAGLVVAGVFVTSYATSKKASWVPSKSTIYALVSGALFGIGIISEKVTLNHIDVNTFIVVSWPFEALFLLLLTTTAIGKWKKAFTLEVMQSSLFMGLLRFAGGFLFVWALENAANTSLVAASGGLQAIFTVLLAAMFMSETGKLNQKLFAAVLAFLGIALMFYS